MKLLVSVSRYYIGKRRGKKQTNKQTAIISKFIAASLQINMKEEFSSYKTSEY